MKTIFMIILAAILITLSACSDLHDNTTFLKTTETDIKESTSAESESESVGANDKSASAETKYSISSADEAILSNSDISELEVPETDLSVATIADVNVSETKAPQIPVAETNIDIDLTTLSGTMVYAEVFNILYSPSDYIGKTVKMSGAFSYYEDPKTKNQYFACIIADATACCAQGLEFVLADDHTYPDDYPEVYSDITVTGIFEIYEENGFQYCRLRDAVLEE